MPAMPKDKATAAVSLNESNFSELKLKELTTSSTATMASTATATNRNLQTNQPQQQQQQQHLRNICGCGAASVEIVGSFSRNKYLTNGHSSPLAAAVAAQQQQQQQHNGTSVINAPSTQQQNCCRIKMQSNRNGSSTNGITTTTTAATTTTTNSTAATTTATTAAASNSTVTKTTNVNETNGGDSTTSASVAAPKKSPKDFIFGKFIGEGSFSIVYLAVDVNTKREFAIKVCKKSHILRERKQDYILREREVLHMMTNVPGFVNLSCTFQDESSLFFVMTHAKNGDLLPYIHKVGSFDVNCTRHYAAELVLACEQLHQRNVVHRDLKPENILLDENMHTLIADFGSSKILTPADRLTAAAAAAAAFQTTSPSSTTTAATTTTKTRSTYARQARSQTRRRRPYESSCSSYDDDDDDDEEEEFDNYYNDDDDNDDEDTNDTGSDDMDSPSRRPRNYNRKRRGSFVGTAQYVSPEVLQGGIISPAADLWALGCIIYQMISGLPPFRASNDYHIFKAIQACNLDFPQGFDKNAEDLVRQLVRLNPEERLGANDIGGNYESIRAHPFFANIDFATLREQTPPPIHPYLPGVSKDDEDFRPPYRVPDNLEPGLDEKQLMRLLGMELGTSMDCELNNSVEIENKKTVTKNIFDLTDAEKQRRLEQQKSDKWHAFADDEVILKKGFVNKRKGLFARKRMLLLTTGPRLIYIDPVQMVKKGEIPWSPELRVEPKNFKIFFVLTPNRTYYLDDPEGYSLEWVDAIEKMREFTYKLPATNTKKSPTQTHSVTRTTTAALTKSAAFATATTTPAVKTASN